jgi:hypothetical protein
MPEFRRGKDRALRDSRGMELDVRARRRMRAYGAHGVCVCGGEGEVMSEWETL